MSQNLYPVKKQSLIKSKHFFLISMIKGHPSSSLFKILNLIAFSLNICFIIACLMYTVALTTVFLYAEKFCHFKCRSKEILYVSLNQL